MADATGETKEPLRVAFDRRLKLEFHGARITSDGGLLAYRELDDALGLTVTAASSLTEGRRGKNIRHRLLGLLRQAVYGRLAGYEDVNDAGRLARDPAMQLIVGREGLNCAAASTSQMGRFETEWLASDANLAALTDLSGAWIDRVHARRPPDGIILDMDSSESPTRPTASRRARPGTGTSAAPAITRCSSSTSSATWSGAPCGPAKCTAPRTGARSWSRCSAATASAASSCTSAPTRRSPSPSCTSCWRARASSTPSACRRTNRVLTARIGHLLTRPVGRPPKKPQVFFASFSYQAQSWSKPRRVVAKVEWHQGELYPRVGFVVTNLRRPAERVVKFYNGRGTAEQWIREGKAALRWTRLSCRVSRANAVRLQLFALAYNLANFLRTLALPDAVAQWSLTTLREKLVKIGARVVRHGRYVIFQLAEVAVPRALFAAILRRIDRLQPRPPSLPA